MESAGSPLLFAFLLGSDACTPPPQPHSQGGRHARGREKKYRTDAQAGGRPLQASSGFLVLLRPQHTSVLCLMTDREPLQEGTQGRHFHIPGACTSWQKEGGHGHFVLKATLGDCHQTVILGAACSDVESPRSADLVLNTSHLLPQLQGWDALFPSPLCIPGVTRSPGGPLTGHVWTLLPACGVS